MVYEPVAETVGHIRIEHTVGGNASQRLGYEILGIVGKYDVVCRFVGIVETHLYRMSFHDVVRWRVSEKLYCARRLNERP